MAKECVVCGKGTATGNQVTFSHHKSRRTWAANIRRVKAIVNGSPKRINVCTRCLRSGNVERAI